MGQGIRNIHNKHLDVLLGTKLLGLNEHREDGVLISLIDVSNRIVYFMSEDEWEWSPTTNTEQAFQIIDKLDKRYGVSIKRIEDYYCFIGDREDYSVYADNHNESLSLAICLTIAEVLDLL